MNQDTLTGKKKPTKKGKFFKSIFMLPMSVKLTFLVILIILLAVIFGLFTQYRTIIKSNAKDLGFKDIGQLATQAAYYSNVQVLEDWREVLKVKVPLTTSKRIFMYDGTIKAGIDFADVEYSADDNAKTVTVILPEVKILSNEIDNDSLEVLEDKDNFFTKLKLEDFNSAQIALKEEGEAKAVQNGLLENARINAELLITGFLKGAYPDYEIVFQ